jgi:hypothetical protein
MARSALVACIAGALAANAGATGCDGDLIHLSNGSGSGGGGSGSGGGGSGGSSNPDGSCPHAQVPASQVVWIGDGWVTIPGTQVSGVQTLARQAGAIGAGDAYTVDAQNGKLIAAIETQYVDQEAMAPVKVLIMDGGTLDTYANNSQATYTAVAGTFNDLLAKVAADKTVTQIIYFLVPELPNIPGVAQLHPLLQQECAASAVPCHFIDLQPLWSDAYTNTASGGILPNDMGAQVIASAVWSVMQEYCIAQ